MPQAHFLCRSYKRLQSCRRHPATSPLGRASITTCINTFTLACKRFACSSDIVSHARILYPIMTCSPAARGLQGARLQRKVPRQSRRMCKQSGCSSASPGNGRRWGAELFSMCQLNWLFHARMPWQWMTGMQAPHDAHSMWRGPCVERSLFGETERPHL